MQSTESTPQTDTTPSNPSPARLWGKGRRLKTAFSAFLLTALLVQPFEIWWIYRISKEVSGLEWSDALHERDSDSVITSDVGTIQFMQRGGYSIQFKTAKFTADGLYLQGDVGNPTRLTISNLSLKFSATKPLYQFADEFDKDKYVLLFGPVPIGESQTSPIGYLGSGMTMPFEVTIPNVKQTKEGLRLVVSFSGERYNY